MFYIYIGTNLMTKFIENVEILEVDRIAQANKKYNYKKLN